MRRNFCAVASRITSSRRFRTPTSGGSCWTRPAPGLTQAQPFKESTADVEAFGRSRGGLTTKLHALVDALSSPVRLVLTPEQRADITQAGGRLLSVEAGAVIADKGSDADALIERIEAGGAAVVIPPKRNRGEEREYDRNLCADRNKIERFFGRIKHDRRTGGSLRATKRPRAATSP